MPRSKSASHSALTAAARWNTASVPAAGSSRRCSQFQQVALHEAHARVGQQVAGAAPRSARVMRSMARAGAPRSGKLPARQQGAGQAGAEEAAAAGDQDVHGR